MRKIVSLEAAVRFAKERSLANPDRQIAVGVDDALGDHEFRITDENRLARLEANAVGLRRLQVAAAEHGGQYEGVTPPIPARRSPTRPQPEPLIVMPSAAAIEE